MQLFAALVATIVLLIILGALLRPLLYNPGPVVVTVAAVAAIVVLILVGQHYEWTGFGESSHPKSDSQEIQPRKTLWDWLQLLIVPLALALIVVVWSTAQEDAHLQQLEDQRAEAQRELAVQQAQDAALQAYLAVMKELLLEQDLRDSGPDSNARAVANVQTLLILEQVDPRRKTVVLRLLTDSHLIDADAPLIETSTLALQGVDAKGMDLSDTDLSRANLENARMGGTNVFRANLSGANLEGADLSGADLREADLSHADLSRAQGWFGGAANLRGADLGGTDLSGANLEQADMSNVKGMSNRDLEQQAASLEGATMPNGQKYEEWLKDREKRQQDE
jgi:hypothetical protein